MSRHNASCIRITGTSNRLKSNISVINDLPFCHTAPFPFPVVGPQGSQGASGASTIGSQGPQGISTAGSQGPQGASGMSAVGSQGPQGAQGPISPVGIFAVTGDTGTAVPISNTLQLMGQTPTTTGLISTASSNVVHIDNQRYPTQYVVDSSPGAVTQYTTVQAAYLAAAASGTLSTVLIRPGTYSFGSSLFSMATGGVTFVGMTTHGTSDAVIFTASAFGGGIEINIPSNSHPIEFRNIQFGNPNAPSTGFVIQHTSTPYINYHTCSCNARMQLVFPVTFSGNSRAFFFNCSFTHKTSPSTASSMFVIQTMSSQALIQLMYTTLGQADSANYPTTGMFQFPNTTCITNVVLIACYVDYSAYAALFYCQNTSGLADISVVDGIIARNPFVSAGSTPVLAITAGGATSVSLSNVRSYDLTRTYLLRASTGGSPVLNIVNCDISNTQSIVASDTGNTNVGSISGLISCSYLQVTSASTQPMIVDFTTATTGSPTFTMSNNLFDEPVTGQVANFGAGTGGTILTGSCTLKGSSATATGFVVITLATFA